MVSNNEADSRDSNSLIVLVCVESYRVSNRRAIHLSVVSHNRTIYVVSFHYPRSLFSSSNHYFFQIFSRFWEIEQGVGQSPIYSMKNLQFPLIFSVPATDIAFETSFLMQESAVQQKKVYTSRTQFATLWIMWAIFLFSCFLSLRWTLPRIYQVNDGRILNLSLACLS